MPSEEEKEPPTVEFVDLSFPTYYTNSMSITSSGLDFSMLVLERIDAENQTIRARIVMTPVHAKLLLSTLIKQVELHESTWGPIRMPKKLSTASSSEPERQP